MILTEWAIILFVVGVVLMVSDLAIPSHGVLTGLGIASVSGAIGVCFYINTWLGFAILLASLGLFPAAMHWVVRYWPKTRGGRQLVLPGPQPPLAPRPLPVQIGQTGTAVSELRPGGVCEFEGDRVEVTSELGIINAGQSVTVVDIVNRKPVVRAV
jgi:membrane-bound serine protease (ClpP class)